MFVVQDPQKFFKFILGGTALGIGFGIYKKRPTSNIVGYAALGAVGGYVAMLLYNRMQFEKSKSTPALSNETPNVKPAPSPNPSPAPTNPKTPNVSKEGLIVGKPYYGKLGQDFPPFKKGNELFGYYEIVQLRGSSGQATAQVMTPVLKTWKGVGGASVNIPVRFFETFTISSLS